MIATSRNNRSTAILLSLILCTACSRGGSSSGGGVGTPVPDTFGPTANIHFPAANSVTDRGTITVTGHAADPSGVDALSVNGVVATTQDAFDSWSATLTLTPGENVIAISATDTQGNLSTIPFAATIKFVGPYLVEARDIRIANSGAEALVIDSDIDALVGVDLLNGNRRAISAEGVGTGPRFGRPVAVAVHSGGQRALVLDQGTLSVFDVDLATGDRSQLLVDADLGAGQSYQFGQSIVIDEANQRAFVSMDLNSDGNGIYAIDLVTGASTPISTNLTGVQTPLLDPAGLDFDAAFPRLFLLDEQPNVLYSVDPGTGTRTVLTGPATGEGPVLVEPHSPRYDSTRDVVYLVDAVLAALIEVNLINGDRTVVSDDTHGSGPSLEGAMAVEIDSSQSRALVSLNDAVIAVDLATGERVLLSGSDIGFGPALTLPSLLDGHLNDQVVIVQSQDEDAFPPGFQLISIDLMSGNRDVVATSDSGTGVEVLEQLSFVCNRIYTEAVALGRVLINGEAKLGVYMIDLSNSNRTLKYVFPNGPLLPPAGSIEFDGSNSIAFVGFGNQVWRVFLETGTAELLTGLGVGSGPELVDLRRVKFHLPPDRLIITDRGRNSVMFVMLATGDRFEITGPLVGSGPLPSSILAVDLELTRYHVAFTDEASGSVYAASIHNGERTLLLDAEAPGSLFPHDTPTDLAVDWRKNAVYVLFGGALDAIVMIELTTLDRVLVSR